MSGRVGNLQITLTIKDPSVTFDARTRANIFGGAADAQPNGFDLMNYTGLVRVLCRPAR